MREMLTAATIIVCLASPISAAEDRYGDALPEGALQRLGTMAMRYPGGIGDLCYLPDGRGAIAVGGQVEIWDLTAGQIQRTDEVTSATIRSIEPNVDGTALLVADSAGDVHLWDLQALEVTNTIATGLSGLVVAHYSPDETRVLTTRNDPPTLVEWDLGSGQKLVTIDGHMHYFRQGIYGPDGRTAFVDGGAGSDPILAHYDLQSGELLHEWHRDYYSHARSLELSPDGERLLAGTRHSAQEWDVNTYEMLGKFTGHHGHAVTSVAYCANPDELLTGSRDGSIRRWNRHEAKVLLRWWPHEGHVTRIEVSPDGKWALSYGAGLVDERAVEDGAPRVVWDRHNGAVTSVAAVPGEDRVVSGSTDETLRVWNPASGESLLTIDGANLGAWVLAVDLSPDGNYAVSGGRDGTVRYWALSGGRLLRTLTGHRRWVHATEFLDQTTAVTADGYGVIIVWDLPTGEVLRQMEHGASVSALAVRDGRIYAAGGRELSCWDAATGERLVTYSGHADTILGLTLTDDGRTVTASEDTTLLVWQAVDPADRP